MHQKIGDIKNSNAIGNNTSGNNNKSTFEESCIEIDKCEVNVGKISSLYVWTNVLSIISLIISSIAIFISAPRCKELGFDYMGVIVTILALLITILIAWQIYITLTLDNRIKQYISERILYTKEEIHYNVDLKIKDYDNHLGSVLLHTKANKIKDKKMAIKYFFKALYFANKSSYKDNIDHLISDLTTTATLFEAEKNNFTKCDIDFFRKVLNDCESSKTMSLSEILEIWEKSAL